jgi:hypothetical protein
MLQAQHPRKVKFCHICGESCYGFYCHGCFMKHKNISVNRWIKYRKDKEKVIRNG